VRHLQDGIAALEAAMARHDFASTLDHAAHACDAICPAMLSVRKTADELEGLVADDLWSLATYQEMLFIK
jgi:glutamine synthetase